jgi:dTDP-4-dehydrorhamnose reductase
VELWASPEPTIARVSENHWRDQLAESGHRDRTRDLELLASLGIDACRYPVLWEHNDLAWARPRLEFLRDSGIEPIVTLLHHGSGPAPTSLIDPDFPTLFAAYAQSVARAFPWIRRWTPINEPLTTARFSTLYGHWYPNLRDDRAFGHAIANEVLAIQLAFERIRAIIPDAQLLITEDLQGFTAGDAASEPYVAFLRERKFLSLEFVMGRVDRAHPLWSYLAQDAGLPTQRLDEIRAHALTPHLVGWNWYPHSERFIFSNEGKTGDLASLYIAGCTISPRPLLRKAYARLGLPQALSEVHINAPERERADWLRARYDDAIALRAEGIPIEAVGAWAAFGMVDWNSLLRERAGAIEDGVFTFAAPGQTPQETEVSRALRHLARFRGPSTTAPSAPARDDKVVSPRAATLSVATAESKGSDVEGQR